MKTAWLLFARFSLLCACCLGGTVAHAGNVRGSWDPQFNATFNATGFLGEITFFVPDLCLTGTPSTPTYIDDGDPCSSGGMYLVDAEVTLYNWPNTLSILNTITFAPPVSPTDPILGIKVQYSATGVGTVLGLDTLPIGPQPSGVSASLAPSPLYLLFSSGAQDFPPLAQGAYLLPQTCEGFEPVLCSPDFTEDARSNAGAVAFATHEPGKLGLLLSAIGAGWLARRRRAVA
jgi:hypothetical protein